MWNPRSAGHGGRHQRADQRRSPDRVGEVEAVWARFLEDAHVWCSGTDVADPPVLIEPVVTHVHNGDRTVDLRQ